MTDHTQQQGADAAQPYPSRPYAWWVLAVLFIAMLVSYIDRQIPALVVDGLRNDLGMSDAQAAWMYSGFALFYAIAGIPLAWLSDRKNRKAIISIGIFFWSVMTVACGFHSTPKGGLASM